MHSYQKKKATGMRRPLPKKRILLEKTEYEYHDDGVLSHQLASLSIPSDIDDDTDNDFLTESISNDTIVDLDRMIAETSARWKCTVSAIVSNTVTANSTGNGSVLVATVNSKAGTNSLSDSSTNASPQQIPLQEPPPFHGMMPSRPSAISRQTSTGTTCTVPGMEHHVIEQQQAEIEALQAALQAQQLQSSLVFQKAQNHFHQHLFSKLHPELAVLNENLAMQDGQSYYNHYPISPEDDNSLHCAPIKHIEVDPDSGTCCQDDLTVWSGFHTVNGWPENSHTGNNVVDNGSRKVDDYRLTKDFDRVMKPMSNRRPDAESATGASALCGVPVRVVKDMKAELYSAMNGVARKALYTGTINAHTRRPEGQGTFTFTKTGDKYRGEVYDGEMHGLGTYTFGNFGRKTNSKSKNNRPKELIGTFEHNVFIG